MAGHGRRRQTLHDGLGIWEWASNDDGGKPDVVMACAGDVPTLETLAAVDLLRQHVPELKIRVINVVDLMTLQPNLAASAWPDGSRFRRAVHRGQAGHLCLSRLSVADPSPDLQAAPTTTNPCARLSRKRARPPRRSTWWCSTNSIASTSWETSSRFVPRLGARAAYAKQAIRDKLVEHKEYIARHGADMPEVADWRWDPGK